MKEPYIEGLANHGDPESCASARERSGEALTGENAGWVLSREISAPERRRRHFAGRPHELDQQWQGQVRLCAVRDPRHAWTLHAREPGDPQPFHPGPSDGRHRKGHWPHLDDARGEEVGQLCSTYEVAEQGRNFDRGGDGGKRAGQGEHRPAKRAPDSEPDKHAKRAGMCASSCKKGQDCEVHFAFPPHHTGSPERCFLGNKEKGCGGCRRSDMGAVHGDLGENLKNLHERLRRGAYRAKPSRRTYIPKADGRQRPLGIAALEDKIVQRATVEVLNAIYEGDFLGFSYGFRPGRSQHQALDALATGIDRKKVGWVLDADIRSFFDKIDHGWLMKFVEHRIADKRILRLIRKWLAAGVMEDGKWTVTEEGTPQGATVSPLLANIFLHYVYDLWVQQWRKKHARGDMIVTRYADDTVVGFQHREDAERFQKDLHERVTKFGLELHPEKTRLIRFGRFAAAQRKERGLGKPETFNFLGLTHICSRTREGKFQLVRQTMRKRMQAKLLEVKLELRRRRHLSIADQGTWLARVLRGYFAYHAVPTNSEKMQQFRTQVTRHWRRALKRRGQRDRTNWERMNRIATRWLPPARIQHPWPNKRFDARIQGKSLVR